MILSRVKILLCCHVLNQLFVCIQYYTTESVRIQLLMALYHYQKLTI